MQLIAHRGFGHRYPQNTVRAFESAAAVADGVEVDVRRSGSDDLVASHYGRLRLITDSGGRVADHSADELESMSVEGSDWGIPRLERVFEVVPDDVTVELDLKEPGLADAALDVAADADNEVVVTSFYSDAIWEARAADADAALSYNFDVRLDRHLTTTELIGCELANVHWSLCLATDIVSRAHERGLDVYAWPVGARPVAWAVRRRGVDGVVATNPGVCEWLEGRI
ncbi:glycerophosphodiester phosphodiesterase [Natronoarchaeum mannanilyticum]|uniref:Glycerophosphodiester phosphodiesterase n=1 Tax=Natronoarchaeum mannanilyticum TaxID=926360 RepID=A0AAV3TDJ7_9EURY